MTAGLAVTVAKPPAGGVIVQTPVLTSKPGSLVGMSNWMTLGLPPIWLVALESMMAWSSEPEPVALVLVTRKTLWSSSTAPMSEALPTGRATPRWSGDAGGVGAPAGI